VRPWLRHGLQAKACATFSFRGPRAAPHICQTAVSVRLALFGGAFDPIHNGHVAAARSAADTFHLDRVLFIPAGAPPHKPASHAPYEARLRMVELACAADPRLEASRLEEGPAPSYSIDTIEAVRASMAAGDELFFLIGADAFADITSWRRWRDVVRAVTFLVVSRPGHIYDIPPEARVQRLDTVDLPISSSEIRRKLAAGKMALDVPAQVLGYIQRERLYTQI
jgi:nicotinate-nucleotide adenylyltransferase